MSPIISGGGAAAGGGAVALIQTITRATDGPLDFTGIPGTYNDLLLVGLLRSTRAGSPTSLCGVRFNNDGGNNYAYEVIQGTASSASVSPSTADTVTGYLLAVAATGTANIFSPYRLEVIGYANTSYPKLCYALTSTLNTGGTMWTGMSSGTWSSTAAINRLTLYDQGAATTTFLTGSTARLYGRT